MLCLPNTRTLSLAHSPAASRSFPSVWQTFRGQRFSRPAQTWHRADLRGRSCNRRRPTLNGERGWFGVHAAADVRACTYRRLGTRKAFKRFTDEQWQWLYSLHTWLRYDMRGEYSYCLCTVDQHPIDWSELQKARRGAGGVDENRSPMYVLYLRHRPRLQTSGQSRLPTIITHCRKIVNHMQRRCP